MTKHGTSGRRPTTKEAFSRATRAQFEAELRFLTRFSEEELATLFPEAVDQEERSKLIEIVDADTGEKEKQAALIANIRQVSGAVIKLVGGMSGG